MAEAIGKRDASDADDHREAAEPPPAADDSMGELRRLLWQPEQTRIDELQRRLDDPLVRAKDVSHILPDAIAIRSSTDKQLTRALMPSIEEGIAASVRKNPMPIANAIFPVIGPAIRKAIAQLFNQMLQSLNQLLEHSLSLNGLRWRLEAMRTGRPFAEVVLRHTLLYRVEHVYLIHRETGLLLLQVARPDAASPDADLISGMLTAIQDFAHDSLDAPSGEALESLRVGELTIWFEQGARAVIAAMIRGTVPVALRATLQDALDSIHLQQREALASFTGDAAPFAACRADLESCLQMQLDWRRKRASPLIWGLTFVVIAIIGAWLFLSVRDSRRWHSYVDSLNREPGIVVVASGTQNGKYFITGLRDPLAADPLALLGATPINPASVVSRWESYPSTHPEFVVKRARQALAAPDSVTLRVEDGILVAEGFAPRVWISDARRLAPFIAGVSALRDDKLIDADQAAALINSFKQQLESAAIGFAPGSAEIAPEEQAGIEMIAASARSLDSAATALGQQVRIEISGHTDESGTERANQRLRPQRAEAVRDALARKGVRPEAMVASADNAVSLAPHANGRNITLKVVLVETRGGR